MNKLSCIILVSLLFGGFALESSAQFSIGSTMVDTSTIVYDLDTPWEILWGPDDHIWMTERYGRVSRLNPENGEITELITIEGVHEESESGLLGMVLHPDFSNHPYVYLVYNYVESVSIKERLVRYTYTDGKLGSPLTLLEGIGGNGNHNGSRLVIDANLMLYMTTGDAQDTNTSQTLQSMNGKVLRLNLDGTVPEDNPIPGSYLWSWGHRNPQGLVISPKGIMYSSEHGPSSDDEINIIEKGRNYGWPDVKGFCEGVSEAPFCTEHNVFEPIVAWTPTLAVAGIDYYSHPAIPEWQNTLLVTTLKYKRLVTLKLSEDGRSVVEEDLFAAYWFGRLRDICISDDGRIFLAVSNKDGRGDVRDGDDRIVEISAQNAAEYCYASRDVAICPGDSYDFYGRELSQKGLYTDTISFPDACDSIIFLSLSFHDIPLSGLEAEYIVAENGSTTLTANEGFVSYIWNDNPPSGDNTLTLSGSDLGQGSHLQSLTVEDSDGCISSDSTLVTVTPPVGIHKIPGPSFSVYPNPLGGNELTVEYFTTSEASLVIYNLLGSEISRSTLSPALTSFKTSLPDAGGVYLIKMISQEGILGMKVLKY